MVLTWNSNITTVPVEKTQLVSWGLHIAGPLTLTPPPCHHLQTAKGLLLNVLEVCLIMGNIQVKFQPLLIPVENNTYKDQIIQIHVDLGLQFGNVFRRLQRLGNLQKCFHRIQNEIHLSQPQNFTRHFFHLVCLIWPRLNWRKRKINMKLSILYWCNLYSCAC